MRDLTQKEMLIKLITEFAAMKEDIAEIKGYTSRINGGLRAAQNDVTEIQVNCTNCRKEVDDIRKRMNVFSTLAAVGGGVLGYLGSYFK
jgi:hypothetical protein